MIRHFHDAGREDLAVRARSILELFPEIAAVYLFGSVARGDATPASDVDLGLVFRRRGDTALDHHRLLGDLASRLEALAPRRPIDLVVLESQGPLFCHRVLLEGALIYEADRDRRCDFESTSVVRALDFRPTYKLATRGRIAAFRRWLRSTAHDGR
ncbi:MAG: nucleotidyltransferase domain-containing protein [Planctomycetes bacterium]|nr:nucleotidyltransferase domain-containing protein [Planctomycetota bacterium]